MTTLRFKPDMIDDSTIHRVVCPEIRALTAYQVPSAAGMVKLDAMENPYPLPDALRQELADTIAQLPLNRYPDAAAGELKATLREAMKIPASMQILVGNGSDEIIQIVTLALARPGAAMLSVEPSFVMYRLNATYAHMSYVGVALKADFSLDTIAVLAAIDAHQPALIFLAYPNNPTGNLFDAAGMRAIIEAAPGLVVADEAYFAFSEASFLPALTRYPNLLVMRTVSKLGLAGIRLGFLAGRAEWLNEFDKVRMPYNVNVATQAIATHLLRNSSTLYDQAEAIMSERAQLWGALAALPGVTVFPTAANFILLRVPATPGAVRVFDGLKQRGILVKNLHNAHALLENCLRVTVGTPEENRQFLSALRASL